MSQAQKIIKILAICLAVVIITNIISGIVFVFSAIFGLNFDSSDNNLVNFEETYQDVRSIKLETISSTVNIKTGDNFKVVAQNVKNNFSVKLVDETLKIEEYKKSWFSNDFKGNITIYIPINYELDNLDIDLGAGKINIENMLADKFDIKQGAGTISILNSKFNKTDIEGGAGKIEINSSTLNNLNLDAGVGQVDINGNITGNSKIECGVGSMNIKLSENKNDYTIMAQKGLGNISIEEIDQKSDITYGTGINKIKLEGGVGSISVIFDK